MWVVISSLGLGLGVGNVASSLRSEWLGWAYGDRHWRSGSLWGSLLYAYARLGVRPEPLLASLPSLLLIPLLEPSAPPQPRSGWFPGGGVTSYGTSSYGASSYRGSSYGNPPPAPGQ